MKKIQICFYANLSSKHSLSASLDQIQKIGKKAFYLYEGRAKSSAINRLPLFYPMYILKYFIALEWCVE